MSLVLLIMLAVVSFISLLNSPSQAGDRARAFVDAVIACIRPEKKCSDTDSPEEED